jgi:hypothetical protein
MTKDQGQQAHTGTTGSGPGQSQEQKAALYRPAAKPTIARGIVSPLRAQTPEERS